MANPQIEDGHVDIANEIIEALAKIRISGEEMQCLWVILRKTYGWHKKNDKISLSQFAQMTGLKRQNVLRAINKLSSKKIIGVIKNDYSQINIYNINKDFDKWEPLSKKITLSSKKITTVINIDNRVSSKKIHTKESITKENIQKKYTSDTKPFLNFYSERFEYHFGIKPMIDWPKDSTLTKNLLKIIPLNELEGLLEAFFCSEDKFILKSGYTIGVFKSQINKLKIGEPLDGMDLWLKVKEEQDARSRQKAVLVIDEKTSSDIPVKS